MPEIPRDFVTPLPSASVNEPTPVQKIGKEFGWGLFLLIGLITIALFLEYFHLIPETPSATADKTTIDNYKAVSALVLSNTKELFDGVVGRVLFPLFTTILGYIFGVGERRT